MSILDGEVLLLYFPAAVLLITLEIVMSIYKSNAFQWTAKLATCNLIVNLMWIVLITVVSFDPNLFNPDFVIHLAGIYSSSSEKITKFINLIMNVLVFSVILTNSIDVYSGFYNVKTKKKSDQS
jgi:cytochrome bd-type quinol oxidase subunit 2